MHRLPDARIFMDVDSLQAGEDFVERLDNALTSAEMVLVIIGPQWLTVTDDSGKPRLSDEQDFVRQEVSKALASGLPVIPVLVRGAKVPSADQLPENLKSLARRQAIELRHAAWSTDVKRLADQIRNLPAERAHRGRWRPKTVFFAASLLILLLAGFGVYRAVRYMAAAPEREIDVIADQIRYENPEEKVLGAVQSVRDTVVKHQNPELTTRAVARLKLVVLTKSDATSKGRHIRKAALETIKVLRGHDLTIDFHGDDLKEADLVEVDLSRTRMKGLNLSGAFLLSCDFSGADLSGANLSDAFIRNGIYDGVDITRANMASVDWFNARGFTDGNLGTADRRNVMSCPADKRHVHTTRAFETEFGNEYTFSLEDIGSDRDDLESFWAKYSKPGGLCDIVDQWKKK